MHVFSYWALAHGCYFDPQIKVKARWTNHELGGCKHLYTLAGLMDLEELLVCVEHMYFIVRRHMCDLLVKQILTFYLCFGF